MRHPKDRLLTRFKMPILLAAGALVYGVVGFMIIERVDLFDDSPPAFGLRKRSRENAEPAAEDPQTDRSLQRAGAIV